MHSDSRQAMDLDRTGRQLFSLLVSLLRPLVRTVRGAVVGDARDQCLAAPIQQGTVIVESGTSRAAVNLTQVFINPYAEPVHLSAAFPLPSGSAVHALHLRSVATSADGEICDRGVARTHFDIARCTGRTAALCCADGPGVFTQEVAHLEPGRPVTVTLRYSYGFIPVERQQVDGARGTHLTLRFDAGPRLLETEAPDRLQRRRLLQLGTGRMLDAFVGIMRRGARDGSTSQTAVATPLPRDIADVFVSTDRPDGSSAAFRGELAGRRVRMVVSMRTTERERGVAAEECTSMAEQLSPSMHAYREATDEADRGRIAESVSRLGLRYHLVTPWTSLVAVADPTYSPDGEAVAVGTTHTRPAPPRAQVHHIGGRLGME